MTKKRKIIKAITIFLLSAGIITFLIYAYFLSFWAYLPTFGKKTDKNYSSIFSPVEEATVVVTYNTPEPSAPAAVSGSQEESQSVENNIKPGIRDKKFVDGDPVYDDMSYHSSDISIEITKYQDEFITYFAAEIYIRNSENLYSGLSNGIDDDSVQKTTEISIESDGIFAVNGDFYNSRSGGVIIRNGELIRGESNRRGLLVFFNDGSMQVFDYENISAQELIKIGAQHSYYFGPMLITEGEMIDDFSELARPYIRQLQPRCAVGQIEPYHYMFVVVDGRSPGYSQGATLLELAEIMYDLGCEVAYNLDGGGSASMVLMGKLVNSPLGYGNEREISDAIVIREVGD